MPQQHVILKFILQPEINDESRHTEIADSLSEIINYHLTDILSKKLDECSEPDKLIRFPKIEIDLGEVKEEDLYEVLTEDLPDLIADKITYKIRTEFIKEEEYEPDGYSHSNYSGGTYYSSANSSSGSAYSNAPISTKNNKPKRTRMLVPQAVMLTQAVSPPKEIQEKLENPKSNTPQVSTKSIAKKKTQSTSVKARTRTIIPQSIGEIPIPQSIVEENLKRERSIVIIDNEETTVEKGRQKGLEQKELERKELEQKGLEQKRLEQKGLERKGLEKKGLEKKGLERKGLEQKGLEQKELEQKGLEQKELEQKGLEQKGLEQKELEKKELEKKGLEQKELEQKELEQKELEQTLRKSIPRAPALSTPVADKDRPTSIATYHAQIDAVVHFLRTGRLPEWIVLGKVTMDELINRLFDRYPNVIGLRLKQMKDEVNVRRRLTEQFSNAVRERIELATGDTFVREEKEREEQEREEQEREEKEREKQEREEKEREKQERKGKEREKQERKGKEREEQERKGKEREKQEREEKEREKQERKGKEREKQERKGKEREEQERKRKEREKQERKRKEREEQEVKDKKGAVPEHLSEIVVEMQDLVRVQSTVAPVFDKKEGFKEYLIYLLEYGEKPWWASNLPDENPENYLFALTEAETKILLLDVLKNIDASKLAQNFSKRAIEKMWTALYPDMVGFIKTVELSLKSSNLSAQLPIWTYLRRNAGNPFNVNSFVSTVISISGNIDKIQAFLKTTDEPRFSALQNVLEFLNPSTALLEDNILEEKTMDKEEIWQSFIKSGTSSISINELSIVLQELLDKTPLFIVQSLRQLPKEKMASNYAFGKLPNAVVDVLLKKLLPVRYSSYRKMVLVLRTLKDDILRAHIIDYAVRIPGERFNIQHYLRDFIKMSVRRRMIDPKAVIQELLEGLKEKETYADVRKDIVNHLKIINQAVKVSKSLRHQTAIKKKEEKEKETEVTRIPYKDGALGEEVYIRNAGIVILWPFLTTYFGRLGMLTEEKEFKDLETASRAVHLLQYLATKFPASEEHELVLNKILCGIPIDTPIEYGITVTEAETEMSDSLLKAVIAQWAALKNSSLDGLRGGFLIREGKLTKKKDKWLLQVEKRTYDILLGKMPWGLSMIKISWMPKMLTVEWG